MERLTRYRAAGRPPTFSPWPCRWSARPPTSPARCVSRGVSGVSTKTTDTDVVTAADQAVERQVRAALAAARPADQVLGEEYGEDDAAIGACGGSSTRSTAP